MLNRRGLIGGFVGLLAAPPIVRAASIMPVRVPLIRPAGDDALVKEWALKIREQMRNDIVKAWEDTVLYGSGVVIVAEEILPGWDPAIEAVT